MPTLSPQPIEANPLVCSDSSDAIDAICTDLLLCSDAAPAITPAVAGTGTLVPA